MHFNVLTRFMEPSSSQTTYVGRARPWVAWLRLECPRETCAQQCLGLKGGHYHFFGLLCATDWTFTALFLKPNLGALPAYRFHCGCDFNCLANMPAQNLFRIRALFTALKLRAERFEFLKSLMWDGAAGRITSLCNKAITSWLGGVSPQLLALVRADLRENECVMDTARTHALVGVAPANKTDPETAKLWTNHMGDNTRGNALDNSLRCIDPLQPSLEGMRVGYHREHPTLPEPDRMTWVGVAQEWMTRENISVILAHCPSHNVCPTCKSLEAQLDLFQLKIGALKGSPFTNKIKKLLAGLESSRDSTLVVFRTHLRRVGHMSRFLSDWIDLAQRTALSYNTPVVPRALLECEAVQVCHIDDKKALTYPHPLQQADENLAKYGVPINGGTDFGTGNFVAHLCEPGSGSKDSNFSVNHLLLHLTDGRFNGHQVLALVFDCAPTERNSHIGGGFIQMLVDRKIVHAAFAIYLINNHGKHICDRHFGVMEKKWRRCATFSIDQVADRARGGTSSISGMPAQGYILNPLSMNDFVSQFKDLYSIPFPREIGAKTYDPYLTVAVGDLEAITDETLRNKVRPYARSTYVYSSGPGWLAIQTMPGEPVDFHYCQVR